MAGLAQALPLAIGWQWVLAWSIAGGCVVLAQRHSRRAQRLNAPQPPALLEQLLSEIGASDLSSENTRRAAIADLNQRLSDVSFELGLLPARFTALTRISLASSTALALFGYIGSDARTPVERVLAFLACSSGGLLGAAIVLTIGRTAKQRAAQIREAWDRSSRETGKALGTCLTSPPRQRSRSDL